MSDKFLIKGKIYQITKYQTVTIIVDDEKYLEKLEKRDEIFNEKAKDSDLTVRRGCNFTEKEGKKTCWVDMKLPTYKRNDLELFKINQKRGQTLNIILHEEIYKTDKAFGQCYYLISFP